MKLVTAVKRNWVVLLLVAAAAAGAGWWWMSRPQIVLRAYRKYLNRTPAATELNGWVSATNWKTEADFVALVRNSSEYKTLHPNG